MATDEPDVLDEVDGVGSPLAALVDAAAEAGAVDPRALAERLGLSAAALERVLETPAELTREQRATIAAALGVELAVVRAACTASPGGRASRGPVPNDATAVADLPEAKPRTFAELLTRTIAAVADDPFGRRLRLSLLATVHTAAAEAGRIVPPESHDLRKRVMRGAVPWVGAGSVIVDEHDAVDDRVLLDGVAAAIRTAQRLGSGYDDLFAPMHDDALDTVLRHVTASPRPAALGATSACAVTPPLFGRYLVVCSADGTPDQRRVALRRALAHVLCGHVGEYTPLPFPAPPAVARAADVFALADLVPFWQLHDWRRKGRLGWGGVAAETARMARGLAGDWEEERAVEGGRLRVRLYREDGL